MLGKVPLSLQSIGKGLLQSDNNFLSAHLYVHLLVKVAKMQSSI